jgi:hypothetical protein
MNKIFKGLMLLGLFFIGLGGYFIVVALDSKSWNQVEGEITEIIIPASMSNAGSATQRHLEYRVEMTYKYQVDGKSYQNRRFSTGNGDTVERGFNNKAKAREWLKSSPYSTGKNVTVYVNPNDAEMTVLSTGINIATIAPILIGLLFFITGYLLNKFIQPTTKIQEPKS